MWKSVIYEKHDEYYNKYSWDELFLCLNNLHYLTPAYVKQLRRVRLDVIAGSNLIRYLYVSYIKCDIIGYYF